MTRYVRHYVAADEDEALDADGILRDGYGARVPLFAMDGLDDVQRAVAMAARQARVTDADGGTAGLHRPGYRIADTSGDERQRAYDWYRHDIENAWRGPINDVRRRKVQGRDPQGRETGIWEEEETDDAAPPLRDGMTLDEAERIHRQRMAREYQAYDHWIADQWRDR